MASRPLPPNPNPTFAPDYPGAFVYPAHPTNYWTPETRPLEYNGQPNQPRAIVLHTPEEDADDWESTPLYFAGANRRASTTWYVDNDGDVIQCVSAAWMAIANGLRGKPFPTWADPSASLNWQTESIEIEGRAGSIQRTLVRGGVQWRSLLDLIRHRCRANGIPIDRDHIVGHYQLSNERTDPGTAFPWDALMEDLVADAPRYSREQGLWAIQALGYKFGIQRFDPSQGPQDLHPFDKSIIRDIARKL